MSTDADVQDELLAFFKLLSNAQRLKITGVLAMGPAPVERLVSAVAVPAADVRRHLRMLCDAGLVAEQTDGSFAFQERKLEEMTHRVLAGRKVTPVAVDNSEDAFERKTLRDFLDADGRLKALPSQQKKLMVVLRYVNSVFAPGTQYTEKQVNGMLARFHEDTAALRRSLVDQHLMARDHGIYWQVELEATPATTDTGRSGES